ncbi:acyltransferase [Luteimonas sp. RD2P54]|uniref:Acyltransferase n=1 Tax=Luteimonas endophytica TaxID=3042023 RepID=A0ABT6JAY4_9GAMM|nr:acyltransferase [Luteimonas endophytica]MDH5823979.1 acyltransferase [Luteimonas endophytica]
MNDGAAAEVTGDGLDEPRDRYPDALRAGALLVVVLGHWIATLPRLEGGRVVGTEHLLRIWESAGALTWVVQVVPLFVFVSAAVSADGVARRLADGQRQRHWWAGRALGLARPTVTYLAVLAALALGALVGGGRLLASFDTSLTVHLWFLAMLLGVQALLPWCVRADRRFGLKAVAALVAMAAAADLLRAGVRTPGDLLELGAHVSANPGGFGWLNMLLVWLVPQQLGIAWKRGRFAGPWAGAGLLMLGVAWLLAAIASGYPVAMVGVGLAGNNMLPPTLALVGVMWLQVGLVLLAERPARRFLAGHSVARAVAVLGALGMPLYLWHKLVELPAAWLGERLGVPIDAGDPGMAGFWTGRLLWILLCALMVAPVMAAVVGFEMRRRRDVAAATGTGAIVAGGLALLGGLAASLALGAWPGALIGLALVGVASWLLRARPRPAPGARE